MGRYEVIVGNVGTVYSGHDATAANDIYSEYYSQSISNYGRAAGENVTLMYNGEISREYIGTLEQENSDNE